MCSDDRRNRSARQPAPIATDRSEMSPLIEARQQRAILVLPQSRQCSVELCGKCSDLHTLCRVEFEDVISVGLVTNRGSDWARVRLFSE